jgi:hypothetical protein
MAALQVAVERIDVKKPAQPAPAATPAPAPALPAPSPSNVAQAAALVQAAEGERRKDQLGRDLLRTQINAHIRMKGDVSFADVFWAGALGENLPMEAFAVTPLEGIAPDQIEYKGLTATGVETPWVSGGALCGTRGMDTPLIGFAVRLKAGADDQFDCEYRGAFRSGKIIGPLINGAPCRADAADDFLEGIQLSIVRRRRAIRFTREASAAPAEEPAIPEARGRRAGPKFSVFREEAV